MSSHESLQGEVQGLSFHKSLQGEDREWSPHKSLQGEGQELIFSPFCLGHVHTEPSVQSISATGTELDLDLEWAGQMEGLLLVPCTPGKPQAPYKATSRNYCTYPTTPASILPWICPAAFSSLHQDLSADTALHCPPSKTAESPTAPSKVNPVTLILQPSDVFVL